MTTKFNKTLKHKQGSIDITAQYNKKLTNCYVYMKMKTSEKWLLYVILQKYIHEKVLIYGCNAVNEIYNAAATPNGIMFVCSEKKVLSNIINTLTYICKTKLSKKELEKVSAPEANYTKLHTDVMSLSVYITGKTIHLIRAMTNSDDKKIDKFTEMLSNIQATKIDNGKTGNKDLCKHEFGGSSRNKLDLSLVLETAPFYFEKDQLILLENGCPCQFCNGYEYMQGKLKSFLVSCGSPGSPAANDEGGKKYKEKCKYILECLNMMTFIVSDLHGFSHEFKNTDEIKNGVSAESKGRIRDCIKALCK